MSAESNIVKRSVSSPRPENPSVSSRRHFLKKAADYGLMSTVVAFAPAVFLDHRNDTRREQIKTLEEDPMYHRSPSMEDSYDQKISQLTEEIEDDQRIIRPSAGLATGGTLYIAARRIFHKLS